MRNFIETEHLQYFYDDDDRQADLALSDVSLTVREGEYVAVLGTDPGSLRLPNCSI